MNWMSLLRRLRDSLYSCPGSPPLLILGGKGCHLGGAFGAQTRSSIFVVLVHRGTTQKSWQHSGGVRSRLLRRVVPPWSSFTKEESLGRCFGGRSGRLLFIHEDRKLSQRRL